MKDTKRYRFRGESAASAGLGTLVFRIGSVQKVGVMLEAPQANDQHAFYYSRVNIKWLTGHNSGEARNEPLRNVGNLVALIDDKNKELNELFGYLAKAQEGAAKCLSTKTSPA